MAKSKTVAIYYDENCGFCKRATQLITKYCLVRIHHIGPAQTNQDVFTLMQKADSWVVVNQFGQTYVTFQAGVEVVRHSPILKWLVPLARPYFMQRFGEWLYRKVANNRSRIPLP
jgi:predicted DCC family thiol-disulfide oxidoreductase YuxK